MTSTPASSVAANPALAVSAGVERCLEIAESWLGWDGRPVHRGENVWTPYKALRRIIDHLLDHLAEVEALLAGAPTIPDRWHGRTITLDSDWARFTEADLDEARSRLTRLGSSTSCGLPRPVRTPGTHRAARPGRCEPSPSTWPKSSGMPTKSGTRTFVVVALFAGNGDRLARSATRLRRLGAWSMLDRARRDSR